MSDNNGVRPRKLWHWGVIALLAAGFVNEPLLSIRFAGDLLRGGGQFVGAALSDAYTEADAADQQPTGDDAGRPRQPDLEHREAEGATYHLDGDTIRAGLDAATGAATDLHHEVENVQAAGGFSLTVGSPGKRGDG